MHGGKRMPCTAFNTSPLLVGKKLAAHRHLDTIAGRVFDFVNVDREVDRTHDAIAEFLLNHILHRHSIDLHDLVEAVDQGIGRDDRVKRALGGIGLQCFQDRRLQVQEAGERAGLLSRGGRLAIEESSDPHLIAAQRLLQILEAEPLALLGGEQHPGDGGLSAGGVG